MISDTHATMQHVRNILTQLSPESLYDLYQCYLGFGKDYDEPQFRHYEPADPKHHLVEFGCMIRVIVTGGERPQYGYRATRFGYEVIREAVAQRKIYDE